MHIRDNSFCDWATKTIFHIADIPWLVLAVCGQWSVPPDCSSALLGKNWSARGGEGEGLWMVEVSMKFRKISQYSENESAF